MARISPPAAGAVSRLQGFGGSEKAPRAGVKHHVSQELLSSNTSTQRSTTPVLPKEVPSRKCVVSPEVIGSMARRPSRSQHPQHLTGWFSWTPGPTGFPFPTLSQRIDLSQRTSQAAQRQKGQKETKAGGSCFLQNPTSATKSCPSRPPKIAPPSGKQELEPCWLHVQSPNPAQGFQFTSAFRSPKLGVRPVFLAARAERHRSARRQIAGVQVEDQDLRRKRCPHYFVWLAEP